MLSLKAQLDKLPEGERIHVVRATRSVLNEVLLDFLGMDGNPIRQSVGASLLSTAIRELRDSYPEADDTMPMRYAETVYSAE